jgi:preprotein translocase subunit SecF
MTYGQMTSLSMNQVLLRSLNTTITSLLPVISLLVVGAGIMGAVTLEEFSIALFVGLVVGAYSSIGVAAPVLVWLKEREPKNRAIRDRLLAQGYAVDHKAARPSGRSLLASEDLYRGEPEPGSPDGSAVGPPSAGDDAEALLGADDAPGAPRPPSAPPRPARPSSGPAASSVIPPRPRKKGRKR